MSKRIVHIVGTGTIGEPLIGLFSAFKKDFGIDDVTFHKRTPLLDERVVRLMEQKRSANMWARAARGDLSWLSTQHNVFLQRALRAAGISCRKCRKKAMAERLVREAAHHCRVGRGGACLARVQVARQGTPSPAA